MEYGALLIEYRAVFDEIHGFFQCRDRLLAFLQEELPAEELREEVVDFMLGAKPDQRCVRVKAGVCLCIPSLSFVFCFRESKRGCVCICTSVYIGIFTPFFFKEATLNSLARACALSLSPFICSPARALSLSFSFAQTHTVSHTHLHT